MNLNKITMLFHFVNQMKLHSSPKVLLSAAKSAREARQEEKKEPVALLKYKKMGSPNGNQQDNAM